MRTSPSFVAVQVLVTPRLAAFSQFAD